MSAGGKTKCNQTFSSGYNKSSLFLLYGGMRKSLFVNAHPVDGSVSSKHIGLKVGKAFYDLNKQELEYKDSAWRVKANFGATQLFNLKKKIGEKKKGETRNNIQFGTDQSNFGSDQSKSTMSIGGMYTCGIAGIQDTTRLKVFTDMAVEAFTAASVAGVQLGCDVRFGHRGGLYTGFVGASYGLPSSIPVLKNVHVGGIISLPTMRPSVGVFAEAPVPSLKKAVVGVELFNGPQSALFGAELVIDEENSFVAKVGDNGIGHFSVIKHFKGLDMRMGVEANLVEGSCGKVGVQVTLK